MWASERSRNAACGVVATGVEPRELSSGSASLSICAERYADVDLGFDEDAVQPRRVAFPLAHGGNRGVREVGVRLTDDLQARDVAGRVDDPFQIHDAADACLRCGEHRFDVVQLDRRADISTDATARARF